MSCADQPHLCANAGPDPELCQSAGSRPQARFDPLVIRARAKGSRKINFAEFAPGFGSDWADLSEQNCRRSQVYVEDFGSEDRPKKARSRDAKMRSYSCARPKLPSARHLQAKDGFVLITTLMVLTLLLSLVLALHLEVSRQWTLTNAVEGQLHSSALAENGSEYARTLLPHLNLEELFVGPDGRPDCLDAEGGRDPLSLSLARRIDPAALPPVCDDGLPSWQSRILAFGNPDPDVRGRFLIRFSNNPEEDPFLDRDREVVVRSMGIVPAAASNPFLPEIRNHVTLIETRLRQERSFDLPGPLVLAADWGDFEWNSPLILDGDDAFAYSVVGISGSGLEARLRESLTAAQTAVSRGAGATPSIADLTDRYQKEPDFKPLLSVPFWQHFEAKLPDFADSPGGLQAGLPGLYYFPRGGRLEGDFSGVLVAHGDLFVGARSEIRGMLLHLGRGDLVLEGGSKIRGGIWMSNFEFQGDRLAGGSIRLRVEGPSQLTYDPEEIGKALTLFPPTQLGWRFIYR